MIDSYTVLITVSRKRLAKLYSQKYAPVSDLLFKRNLPSGKDWPGTKELL